MYVIVGVKPNKNQVGVIDTSDKKTDWVTVNQLKNTMAVGVPVYGFRQDGTILCQTEDVFSEIATQLYAACAKATLLRIEKEDVIRQLFFNIAQPYGLALTPDDLSVSVKDMQIYFKLCGRVCAFGDKNNVVTQTGTRGLVLRKEAGPAHSLVTILKDIIISDKKGNTDNVVHYIGETPSNGLYKIIIGKFVYTAHYSSIFDFRHSNIGTSKRKSILDCFSSSSPSSYQQYLEKVAEDYKNLLNSTSREQMQYKFIDKLTKKSIKADNPRDAYAALHTKYTTLVDRYMDLDE